MLRRGLAALGAERELLGMLGVVRTAFAGSRIGMSAFWNCHVCLDLRQIIGPADKALL